MQLVGFSEGFNQEGAKIWTNQGTVNYLKMVRLDLAAGLSLV